MEKEKRRLIASGIPSVCCVITLGIDLLLTDSKIVKVCFLVAFVLFLVEVGVLIGIRKRQ